MTRRVVETEPFTTAAPTIEKAVVTLDGAPVVLESEHMDFGLMTWSTDERTDDEVVAQWSDVKAKDGDTFRLSRADYLVEYEWRTGAWVEVGRLERGRSAITEPIPHTDSMCFLCGTDPCLRVGRKDDDG